ncbi:MAG TPA: selenocysteine-specific translation elongation factor [Candidatus Acidoferrales bacterium]|nr:selenocysteine-specific translation elongation factor [Candidatus Acidoferrales bacterium]
MEATKHVIVGTAGHIDHGKSTLIEALTGTNPDRLEEEKRRGITIDLGFAFLELDGVRFGFVDVPGHEKFVRNMLAGVGGIDLVVLVIAADESIKPQTREHFDICRLLGISRGLVAITKSDLVDADGLGLVRLEVEDFVRGSFLEGAPIVPVSATTGAGLDAFKKALLDVARSAAPKDISGHFRLPIDRSFAMKGFGTVVTGTLVSGALKVGDEAEIYPVRRRVRVRGLHSGGHAIDRAVAGQRTAVNLAGVEHGEIARGMLLAPASAFEPTTRADVRITLLESARPLKNRTRVHFHQGTAETIAEIVLLEGEALLPRASGLAQVRLENETLLLPGDRFILRQFSPVVTIGGGVVIDALAPRHRRNDPSILPFLKRLEGSSQEEILAALLDRSARPLATSEIIARTGWTEAEIRGTVGALVTKKTVRIVAEQPLRVAAAHVIAECVVSIRHAIEQFHRANPLMAGIPKQDLRGSIGNPDVDLFQVALDDATRAGAVAISGDLVRRAGREIALSADEARAKEIIASEFERAGLAVPSFAAVLEKLPVERARAQKIFQILLREKTLIKVAEDLAFHQTAVARLRELVAGYKKQKGASLPVPAFKELTGVTRKYAIPLLEYLDREHVTRRVGDQRVIL